VQQESYDSHAHSFSGQIGRTEAISNECNPVFSRPVIVTYRGPDVQQQIQVNVVSYAFKMRDGMQLGDCTILLDDLVHARTARVLKQPLLSPDHTRANGYVIINASRHEPRESGMWVQLDLSAHHIPWITPSGEKTTDAQKGSLPNVFFEVWQQSSEGEKQVFKSETTSRNRDPDWWPIALHGRKLGGDAEHDSCIWIRFWNQRRSNDLSETIPPNWIGECRLNLRELITGRAVPILDKWPDTSYNKLLPAEKGQPQLLIQDCKWLKLSANAKLECEPKYKQDMDFLKDLMENVDLDAATMESCLSCYHFVESRAKVWAMRHILKDSEKFDAAPQVQSNAEDPPAFHAQDYDTAHHHLVEHTPVTRRRQSMMRRNELEKLHQRSASRFEGESSPVSRWSKVKAAFGAVGGFKKFAAVMTRPGPGDLMEDIAVLTDKTQTDAPEGSDARASSSAAPGAPRGESASSTSLTQSRFNSDLETRPSSDMTSFCGVISEHESLEPRSLLATNLREVFCFQEDGQQNAAKDKARVPRLRLGAGKSVGQTERPQSAHALSGNDPQEPSTERARASGSGEGGACGGRQQWRPSSARSRPLSARPVSARSFATSVSEGWGGTRSTTPAAATLQVGSTSWAPLKVVEHMCAYVCTAGHILHQVCVRVCVCVCGRAKDVLCAQTLPRVSMPMSTMRAFMCKKEACVS
jgi:hypothetical protein